MDWRFNRAQTPGNTAAKLPLANNIINYLSSINPYTLNKKMLSIKRAVNLPTDADFYDSPLFRHNLRNHKKNLFQHKHKIKCQTSDTKATS